MRLTDMIFLTGSDLRIMRRKARLTTTECAKIAGVKTRKTYENWEKGLGKPDFNQFMRLVIACGLKWNLLIEQLTKRAELEDEHEFEEFDLDLGPNKRNH